MDSLTAALFGEALALVSGGVAIVRPAPSAAASTILRTDFFFFVSALVIVLFNFGSEIIVDPPVLLYSAALKASGVPRNGITQLA